MISITNPMYAEMADLLAAQWGEGQHFYNGSIHYDTEEFYSTLTCSLILYRSEDESNAVKKTVPVWWDFSTCVDGALTANDFSWSEFVQFFSHE